VTADRRACGEDGSSDALGLALLAPAAIGLAIVLLFLSRGVDSRATAMSAAESAAQAAVQERTPAAARAAADRVAAAMLTDGDTCASPSVVVDLGDFRPGGVVAVTVSCSTSSRGLELVDPPDLGPATATAYAVVDPLRGVGP
jgi:hypothetical protein